MNKMQQRVHEFLLKHLGAAPNGWPNETGVYNKWLLIREEYCELTEALGLDAFIDNDITGPYLDYRHTRPLDEPKTVDAICDLLYVIFNLCEELELDIEPFFNEVHRSNMTKVPAALSPNKKVQKGPSWEAPRIAEMLANYRRNAAHMTENRLRVGQFVPGTGDGTPLP
jgi:NTP pyrophosphatase (non-canonical NTP hydrolase)